jgi:hypothetical protein
MNFLHRAAGLIQQLLEFPASEVAEQNVLNGESGS